MNLLSMNLLLLALQETPVVAPVEPVVEAATQATSTTGGDWTGVIAFLTLLALVIIPFLLGRGIANALRMKKDASRIGLVLFTIVLAIWPFVSHVIKTNGQESPFGAIRLGIDLDGGTNMEFAVNREEAEASGKTINGEIMDKMVSAVSRRVNPTGTEEVSVRRVGADRIEVIVPGADQEKIESTKRKIVDLGKLEFSILANPAEHPGLIQQATALGTDVREILRDGQLIAKWRPSAIDVAESEERGSTVYKVSPNSESNFSRQVERDGKTITEFLVVVDPDPKRRIEGDLLQSVRETFSDRGMAVAFNLTARGGSLMQQLSTRYQERPGAGYRNQLAILLNDELQSAPTIEKPIGANGIIHGNFSQQEIDELLSVLNAGALQVPLYRTPVSEYSVSPLLGVDVKQKGITAMIVSIIVVLLITAGYYLKAGLIADMCLILNLILVMGAMCLIDATFTLPGFAGLVLSIGMAVDSNVLIFERMREERARGSTLKMSIKNGFEKAYGTIFDSNVTTLITAVVLYYVGTEQVKGFAVTLFIGVAISMFTAVYVGRLLFDIAEHKKILTDVKMLNVVPKTNINFLGMTPAVLGFSAIVLIGGLAIVGLRGSDNLDIDFRGGSMVTFKFEGNPPPVDDVHKALEKKFEKSLSLEQLSLDGANGKEVLYRMRSIESDPIVISQSIREVFEDSDMKLVQQHVEITPVTEIPPAVEGVSANVFAGGHQASVKLAYAMLPDSVEDTAFVFLKERGYVGDTANLVSATAVDEGKAEEIQLQFAPVVTSEDAQAFLTSFQSDLDKTPHFEELNTFNTAVAGDTQKAALWAIAMSMLAIITYLWVRFQNVTFGLAACAALLFDVLITLASLSAISYLSGTTIGQLLMIDDFKINLTIVASFLTIVGYSLNDKIVVFDRIRELRGRNPLMTEKMVNQSLNQTLSRTLLTACTTLAVLFIMYVLGGDGIHGFSYCLIVGIVVGTFSSIFIAAPALLWLTNRKINFADKSLVATA